MVARDLAARGVTDPRVLAAMAAVPRERFVDPAFAEVAYEDRPLPLRYGQTISQPLIVAMMAEAAEIGPGDTVLEVGTGCGYAAAVLAELAEMVHSVERLGELAVQAAARLERLAIANVAVHEGRRLPGVAGGRALRRDRRLRRGSPPAGGARRAARCRRPPDHPPRRRTAEPGACQTAADGARPLATGGPGRRAIRAARSRLGSRSGPVASPPWETSCSTTSGITWRY